MWRLSDPGTIEVLANSFAQNQLFIADGHHRYEAALRFRSRVRSEREVDPGESINYRMMMLVSVSEPGLVTRGFTERSKTPPAASFRQLRRCCGSGRR